MKVKFKFKLSMEGVPQSEFSNLEDAKKQINDLANTLNEADIITKIEELEVEEVKQVESGV